MATLLLASSSRFIRLSGLVANVGCKHKNTNNLRNNVRRQSSSDTATAPVRQAVTKEERSARRAARKERANAFVYSVGAAEGAAKGETAAVGNQVQKAATSASGPMFHATRLGWYAAVLIPAGFIAWGIVDEDSPPAKLSRMAGLTDKIEEFSKPVRVKLLPDWDQIPNIPPNFPAPPTLVIDLENTLVSSTWDRRYGWRHAKRPGVDKFLATMAQYYEIVLFTPSPDGMYDFISTFFSYLEREEVL